MILSYPIINITDITNGKNNNIGNDKPAIDDNNANTTIIIAINRYSNPLKPSTILSRSFLYAGILCRTPYRAPIDITYKAI